MDYMQLAKFEANQRPFSNEKHSETLALGSGCLSYSLCNVNNALKRFPYHSTEIILAELYFLLVNQLNPNPEVLRCTLELIVLSDKYMHLR